MYTFDSGCRVHPLVSGDGVGHLSVGSSVLKQWRYNLVVVLALTSLKIDQV